MEIQPTGRGQQGYQPGEIKAGRFFPHKGGELEVQKGVIKVASSGVKPDRTSQRDILSREKRPLDVNGVPIKSSTQGVKEFFRGDTTKADAFFSSISAAADQV